MALAVYCSAWKNRGPPPIVKRGFTSTPPQLTHATCPKGRQAVDRIGCKHGGLVSRGGTVNLAILSHGKIHCITAWMRPSRLATVDVVVSFFTDIELLACLHFETVLKYGNMFCTNKIGNYLTISVYS